MYVCVHMPHVLHYTSFTPLCPMYTIVPSAPDFTLHSVPHVYHCVSLSLIYLTVLHCISCTPLYHNVPVSYVIHYLLGVDHNLVVGGWSNAK